MTTRPKLHGAAPTICPDCQLRGVTQAPCKHQLTGGPIGAVPRIKDCAPVLPLDPALGYTTGAGSALGQAWAEADRLHTDRENARSIAEALHVSYRRAYERAEAVGPRPNGPKTRAGGALTGAESALSSLPSCPALPAAGSRRAPCGKPSRPVDGRVMECAAGHRFAGTPREHEQARGALAAAERRAPHVQAERAGTRERLRAEVETAERGGKR